MNIGVQSVDGVTAHGLGFGKRGWKSFVADVSLIAGDGAAAVVHDEEATNAEALSAIGVVDPSLVAAFVGSQTRAVAM